MASDTKSLDEQIRQKARKALRESLQIAANQFHSQIAQITHSNYGGLCETTVRHPEQDTRFWITELTAACVEAAYKFSVPRVEQEAIYAFLRKVDSLQSQVEELREGVSR